MSASPSVATIRAAIVSSIRSAMNAGAPGTVNTVHDFVRFWRDQQKFEALFKRTDSILTGRFNGWMIEWTSREEEAPEWFRFYEVHRFTLKGLLAVQDYGTSPVTQTTFIDQIEAIRNNLRLNTSIFGNTEMTSPKSDVSTFAMESIGEITCWVAEIVFEAESIDERFV